MPENVKWVNLYQLIDGPNITIFPGMCFHDTYAEADARKVAFQPGPYGDTVSHLAIAEIRWPASPPADDCKNPPV